MRSQAVVALLMAVISFRIYICKCILYGVYYCMEAHFCEQRKNLRNDKNKNTLWKVKIRRY